MSDEKPERDESGEQSEENGEKSESETSSRDGKAKGSLAESIMSDFVNKENSGDGGGSQRSRNSKSGSSRSDAKVSGSGKGSGRSGASQATAKSKHSEKSESSSEKEEHHSEKHESSSEKEQHHSEKSESSSEKEEHQSEKSESASKKEESHSEKHESSSEKEESHSEKHESSSEKEEKHSESSSRKSRRSEKHDSEGSDEREYGTETDGRRSEAQDYDEETSESRQDRQREEEEERRRQEEERLRREEEERLRREEEERLRREEAERRRQHEEEEEEDRRRDAQRREEERLKQIRERQIEKQKLDLALTRMLKRKILPDYEIIADVINYAKQKSEQMIQQEDYDTAGEIDVAIDVMFTHMEQERAARGDTPEARALRQRLNTCKGAEKSIEKKYEQLQEQVKEDARQKMAELEAYHQEEQDIFRENWSRPEAKIPFSKPSAELIEMRKQQQVRAYLHDFKTAKAIQQEARSLEEKEAAAGAKRFEAALKTAYQQLVQRQQREVQCLIENVELQLTNLERMKEKELSTNNTTQKNLEMRLTSMKQPPKRAGGLPQIKSRGGISKAPSNATVAIAHRTRMRMPPGLRAPDMMRLDLKTNDVRKILEGSKRSSRAPSSMQKTV